MSYHFRSLVIGTVMSVCGFAHLHAAVELRVTSGDLYTGEIVEETSTTLQLKRMVMIKHNPTETILTIDKSTITSRKEVPSMLEQYQARAEKTPDILLPQCSLARWCYERALVEQSLQHTKKAEKLDSNNPIVTKLYEDLGYVREGNSWVSQEEYLAKTGKVNVGGTIMTKEEAAAAKEQILTNSSKARLEQQIRDAEWLIKNSESKVAEYTQERDKAKADEAKAKSEAAGAKNRAEALAKRMDERNKAGRQNLRTQDRSGYDQAAIAEATKTYQKASADEKKATREKETAEGKLEKYKISLEKAKKELPGLKKQLAELTGESAEETPAKEREKESGKAQEEKKDGNREKSGSRFGDLK